MQSNLERFFFEIKRANLKLPINEYELKPGLYIIPTPIGNMMDITLRALYLLNNMDYLACEDTRSTSKILNHYEIAKTKMFSYHDHNEAEKVDFIIELINNGNKVGLVSEAGTPLISDPGFRIVQKVIEKKLHLEVLPGATAFVPALILSGFPNHNFEFLGFPPAKKNRQKFIKKIAESEVTVIIYESPYKILKILEELKELLEDDRKISVSRELTKIYDETIRGTIEDVISIFKNKGAIKGEFVIVIEGKKC